MPAQATSRERGTEQDASRLRDELARSEEEVLRLRDLLIGRDAEVGRLRGRVAELEEGAARLLTAGARLRARLPSSIRGAGKLLRRRG